MYRRVIRDRESLDSFMKELCCDETVAKAMHRLFVICNVKRYDQDYFQCDLLSDLLISLERRVCKEKGWDLLDMDDYRCFVLRVASNIVLRHIERWTKRGEHFSNRSYEISEHYDPGCLRAAQRAFQNISDVIDHKSFLEELRRMDPQAYESLHSHYVKGVPWKGLTPDGMNADAFKKKMERLRRKASVGLEHFRPPPEGRRRKKGKGEKTGDNTPDGTPMSEIIGIYYKIIFSRIEILFFEYGSIRFETKSEPPMVPIENRDKGGVSTVVIQMKNLPGWETGESPPKNAGGASCPPAFFERMAA